MRESVHAGGAHQRRGDLEVGARVDQHQPRGELHIGEQQLGAVVAAHPERRRDFGAGGGLRNGHDRQLRREEARRHQRIGRREAHRVVGERTALRHQQRDRLGRVGGAAAADGDEAVDTLGQRARGQLLDQRHARMRGHRVGQQMRQVAQRREAAREQGRALRARAAQHQRPRDAQRIELGAQAVDGAFAHHQPRGDAAVDEGGGQGVHSAEAEAKSKAVTMRCSAMRQPWPGSRRKTVVVRLKRSGPAMRGGAPSGCAAAGWR